MNQVISKTIIFLLLQTAIHIVHAQGEGQITVGTKHFIHSSILDENREYWVSLPEGYQDESQSYKRYPVLIILDGRVHFKSISGMINYMSAGYNGNRKIPEMIVVAIQNVNRNRDFTPDKIITKRQNVFGGGDNFLGFLEEELIPVLDKEYRTIPYRILFGHSLGGLLATHTYMKDTTLFNSFIAVDPSFGSWDSPTMDKKLDLVTENSFNRFIYLASANWGKRNTRNRHRHVRLYELLNSKCKKEFPAKLEYFENEDHGSVSTIAFYNGITSIFKGYGISYRDVKSKEQLEVHFKSISSRLSWDFDPPEALVNRVGYSMMRNKNAEIKLEALSFFKLNTLNYPSSSNAFDSLGEMYESMGDDENAIVSYKQSIDLNSNNIHAKERIVILEEGKD